MIALISAIVAIALVPQGGQGGRIGQGNRGVSDMGTLETFEHILTPGDKTDFDLKCKAGEVIVLRVTSDTFDPGVEFCDKDDKKIAENDDEADGVQSAQLLVYVEKEGDYKIHVKNYRNAGGGKYELSVRRFQTQTIRADTPGTLERGPEHDFYARILVPKGKLISLHSKEGSFSQPIDPNGKQISWRPILGGTLTNVFNSKEDTYYVRVFPNSAERGSVAMSAVVATERTIEIGKPATTTARDTGIDVWKLKVKTGDFLTFSPRGKTGGLYCYFPPEVSNPTEGGQGFKVIPATRKWEDTVTVMFTKTGEVDLCVPPSDPNAGYTFDIENAWKPWDGQSPIAENLEIGSTVYYGFDAEPGHIARLAASAKTFDLIYRLYDSALDELQAIDDDAQGNYNATTTISLPRGGRHYLAISCFGSGGGGAYQVSTTMIKPGSLEIGKEVKASLASPLDGLWTLKVDKPQTLTIRIKSADTGSTSLMDPNGDYVPVRSIMLRPGDFLLVFDAPSAGTYRLWRQWRGQVENYSLKVGPIVD